MWGAFISIFRLEESKKGRVLVINTGWPSEKQCVMGRIQNPIRESRDCEKGSCACLKDRDNKFLDKLRQHLSGPQGATIPKQEEH
jgi:hypothetical protein